jgi:predicted transcriptional regulator
MSEEILNLDENEYQTLKTINDQENQGCQSPSQRDIARALGMSVGMTNAIIKRLAAKGWLVIKKVNGRNLSYALSSDGAREVAKRSYRYLRRTIGNVVRWKDIIDGLVSRGKADGCTRVLLVGASDIEFIVEHSAMRHGMVFIKSVDVEQPGWKFGKSGLTLTLYSERISRDDQADLADADDGGTTHFLKEALI